LSWAGVRAGLCWVLAAACYATSVGCGLGLLFRGPGGFVYQGTILVSGEVQRYYLPLPGFDANASDMMKFASGPIPLPAKRPISPDCIDNVRCPPFAQPERVRFAIVKEAEIWPGLFLVPFQALPYDRAQAVLGASQVPALVVDGALDLLVGEDLASTY